MDLHHLRYFEAVARLGYVTRAAHELHIAQPSLSKQIKVLETELGVALFHRVGRRVELTDAGATLLPFARRIMRDVVAARDALQQRADLATGHVSIGATPTVGTHLLPAALAEFNTRYRGIELELHEEGAGRLVTLLDDGTVDLAVVSVPQPNVASAELFTEDLVIAVAPDHPLARRKHVRTAELRDEGWIMFPVGYELREQTLRLCRDAGFEPRVVLDGGEMDTVLRLAAVGLGVAIVPRLALHANTDLIGLPLAGKPPTRTLRLIWHRARQLSPAARALQQFLIERLRER